MTLRLAGSSSGFVEIDSPAVGGNNTLVLPGGNGSARQTMMTDGAGALSFQWDAGSLFYRLDSSLVGANVNTAQSVFGVGVTLASNTVYAFEQNFVLTKTTGATSHTVSNSYAGTATLNNILYQGVGVNDNASLPVARAVTTQSTFVSNSAAALVTTVSISVAAQYINNIIRGTVSINAGGTFIPQYTLSAAPGGAYSTVAGSYIKFTPIGAAGSASSQGTWS